MPNTLFQFVSLRGTAKPSLNTQDVSPGNSTTISKTNGYKGIAEYSDADKKLLLAQKYQWVNEDGRVPALIPSAQLANISFQEIPRKLQAFVLSASDYAKVAADLELALYRRRLGLLKDGEENKIAELTPVVLINAFVHKKELEIKLSGTALITDVKVNLPVRVLTGRKYDRKDKPVVKGNDIRSDELYKADKQLLKEISAGTKGGFHAASVFGKVQEDAQTLTQIRERTEQALSRVKEHNEINYQNEYIRLNPAEGSSKKGIFSKAASFLFGETAKQERQPSVVRPAVTTVDDLKLSLPEKELLVSLGVGASNYTDGDVATLKRHEEDLLAFSGKISHDAMMKKNFPGRYVDVIGPLSVFPSPAPTPVPAPSLLQRPEIRNVGIGDLYRVEEKTIGYKPAEISYIENVMSSESRKRVHKMVKEIETVTETEEEQETDTERDLTTTNRFNLKTETDKTLKDDLSVQGGVNTSGQYGPVKVETNTQVSFQRSSEQATKEAIETANEVVSKAVERTKLRTREFTRVTERLKLSEANQHHFVNPATNPHINGIFQFVDKIKEVSLLYYGRRLMLEFYVPEPAMTLLQKRAAEPDPDYPDPGVFNLRVSDIQPGTYFQLASQFGTGSLDTPPPETLTTGFSWKSSVDEEAENWGEETAEGKLLLPKGYYAEQLFYSFAALRNDSDSNAKAHVSISVAGVSIIDIHTKHIESSRYLNYMETEEGLPVSIRVSGHWDKTAVVNLRLVCRRTAFTLDAWRLKVFQDCKQRFDELKGIYLRRKEEQQFSTEPEMIGRSERENRQTIEKELKKWCIKAMRGTSQNIDDTVTVGSLTESDPYQALDTQPLIWFHENSFEWSNMVYIFYPYFWGGRSQWLDKLHIRENDNLFQEFLQAGYAKVIVPANPEAEEYVLRYVGDPTANETTLYEEFLLNPDDPFGDLWMELLEDKVGGLSRGSGTLSVNNGQNTVTINPDSNWELTVDDVARVIVIEGVEHEIISVSQVDNKQFVIDRSYERSTNASARYFIKGKRIGSPWQVAVPTELTYLTNKSIDQLP